MSAGSRTASVAACAGVVLGASLACAEPSADGLETVIATGTRLPAAAPIVTSSVLDAEQIARRNDPDITELLTAVPGVYVESAGSRGSIGSLFVRGGEANFTQVFVDGVQVNDPTNTRGGSFDFAALDVDEVERIEVVRGPLSSIYGSDALAGVIQIFTSEPSAQTQWRAGYDTGGTGLWRARLGSTGGFGRASSYSVQATSEQDSQDRDIGAYRGRALSGSIGLGSREDLDIELHARHAESESRAFPDASGGPRLASLREQDSRDASDDTLGFALTTRPLDDRWQWHFDATRFEHEERSASVGVLPGALDGVPPSDDDALFLREKLGFYVTSPAERGWQGAFGVDRERESGATEGTISFAPGFDVSTSYDIERVTTGLFAEATAPVGERLALNAALRRDDSEAAGVRTTGRVAARYRLGSAGTSLRASWAEGFKLPSLFSLGHPLVGNPDLKPERTRAIELALESGASSDGVRWQISAFAQHFRDLIDFDFESFMSVNRSRVDASGLELEVGYTAQRWNLAAHATALDISVLGSSEPLNQRPERLAAVSGGWKVAPALTLFAAWRHVGARYDSSIPTGRERLSGFARWDLSLGWQTSPQVRLSLALDNAFDETYETAIGFPDPGRVVRIGVRYRSN